MKARLITRCGCERTIDVTAPPPPNIHIPLRPSKANEGIIRPWMSNDWPQHYDPKRHGVARVFVLSRESFELYRSQPDAEVWYDEATEYDPPGFDADRRTYSRWSEI